jgi:hypothetical protein
MIIPNCALCRISLDDAGPLCPGCHRRAAAALGALGADVAELATLPAGAGACRERVSGSRSPTVPVNLDADEVARDIAWRCGVWEPPVREAVGLAPAPERIPLPRLTDRAAAVLSTSLSAFLALPPTWGYPDGLSGGCVARSGLYGALSLIRLHERARHLIDGAEAAADAGTATRAPGRCRLCGTRALIRYAGAVGCACCGRRDPAPPTPIGEKAFSPG